MDTLLEYIRGTIWLASIVIYLVLIDILLTLSLFLSPFFPKATYAWNSIICAYSLWSFFQYIFETLHGARITFSGNEIPNGESAIVICNVSNPSVALTKGNHTSWSDFYLVQGLAKRRNMLGYCRYFAKRSLSYIPFLGWALVAVRMVLISRHWARDRAELEKTFAIVRMHRWPLWLVSYAEGTRITPQKLAASQQYCKEKVKPVLRHCLFPRTKGFVAMVDGLRGSQVTHIYDLTIAYKTKNKFNVAPTIWETMCMGRLSPPWRFHVHARRYEMSELPRDDEKLALWLEQRWQEKDQLLHELCLDWTAGVSINDE